MSLNLLSLRFYQLYGFLSLYRNLIDLLGDLCFKISQRVLNRFKKLVQSNLQFTVNQTNAVLLFKCIGTTKKLIGFFQLTLQIFIHVSQ